MHERRPTCEIDPDILDVLIQSLSVLSNVATLAATWAVFRAGQILPPQALVPKDAMRPLLRQLRRNLGDSFEAVDSVIRILDKNSEPARPSALSRDVRFGHAIMLSVENFSRVNGHLGELDAASSLARSAARSLQILGQHAELIDVKFDTEDFNTQLNSILFDSKDVAEAMEKLRNAQRRAEDFVAELERGLQSN